MRISRGSIYMEIAATMAQRSTCLKGHVGAVAISEKLQILTVAYNGAPHGLPHCEDVGCLIDHGRCIRTIHAEMNLIIQAAQHGISLDRATVFVTHFPCFRCFMALSNAGVKSIVFGRVFEGSSPELVSKFLSNYGGVLPDVKSIEDYDERHSR